MPHQRRMLGSQLGVSTEILAYDRKGRAAFVGAIAAVAHTVLHTRQWNHGTVE